ncbi:MAG: hypothetical protein WCK89_20090 [bacterium]
MTVLIGECASRAGRPGPPGVQETNARPGRPRLLGGGEAPVGRDVPDRPVCKRRMRVRDVRAYLGAAKAGNRASAYKGDTDTDSDPDPERDAQT